MMNTDTIETVEMTRSITLRLGGIDTDSWVELNETLQLNAGWKLLLEQHLHIVQCVEPDNFNHSTDVCFIDASLCTAHEKYDVRSLIEMRRLRECVGRTDSTLTRSPIQVKLYSRTCTCKREEPLGKMQVHLATVADAARC